MTSRQLCVGVGGLLLTLACTVSDPAQAAQSIRVLLASDVQRLELGAKNTIWMTDAQDRAQFFQSSLRIEVQGQALLLNGTRVVSDQLTVRAGEQILKLWLPPHNGNGDGPALQ